MMNSTGPRSKDIFIDIQITLCHINFWRQNVKYYCGCLDKEDPTLRFRSILIHVIIKIPHPYADPPQTCLILVYLWGYTSKHLGFYEDDYSDTCTCTVETVSRDYSLWDHSPICKLYACFYCKPIWCNIMAAWFHYLGDQFHLYTVTEWSNAHSPNYKVHFFYVNG